MSILKTLKTRIILTAFLEADKQGILNTIVEKNDTKRYIHLAQTLAKFIEDKHKIRVTSWDISATFRGLDGVINKTITHEAIKYRATIISLEAYETIKKEAKNA